MRCGFWLDMGVDGFRLDAVGTIFEDPALTSHSVPMTLAELRRFSETAATPEEKALEAKYWHDMFQHQWGGPGLHDLMKELRAILDEYSGDRMLVGEDDDIAYLGNGDDELHLVFNFPLMRTERITPAHIRAEPGGAPGSARRAAGDAAGAATRWATTTTSRIFTRYATSPADAPALARLNAALVLTLAGTPFLYNGEEIGMTDLIITDPGRLRDTMATWYYEAAHQRPEDRSGRGGRVRAGAMSRDKNRTPMQWTGQIHAGFCPAGVVPWLPVNPNYAGGVNVSDQQDDPRSLLNFYRRLIRVRRQIPCAGDR